VSVAVTVAVSATTKQCSDSGAIRQVLALTQAAGRYGHAVKSVESQNTAVATVVRVSRTHWGGHAGGERCVGRTIHAPAAGEYSRAIGAMMRMGDRLTERRQRRVNCFRKMVIK